MREFTVKYRINDNEFERLEKMVDLTKKQGVDTTPENIFDFIMTIGSDYDKDKKFEYYETILGILQD